VERAELLSGISQKGAHARQRGAIESPSILARVKSSPSLIECAQAEHSSGRSAL
jgi:hypothetical protein